MGKANAVNVLASSQVRELAASIAKHLKSQYDFAKDPKRADLTAMTMAAVALGITDEQLDAWGLQHLMGHLQER